MLDISIFVTVEFCSLYIICSLFIEPATRVAIFSVISIVVSETSTYTD